MDELLAWLLGTYNLPFLIPLGLALALSLMEVVTGGLSDLLSVDLDVDVDKDIDVDFGGLGWLGFGKAPISILIEVMLASFGLTGLLVTAIGNDLLGWFGAWMMTAVALPVAFVVSLLVTRMVGMTIHRLMPKASTTVQAAGAYVGSHAKTLGIVTTKVGQVQVENPGDAPVLLNVYADEQLPRGTEVVLVSYDAERRRYRISRID
ncbi:MAG: hypothetical protein AAFV53_38710 [Myxococcota bacterium]